MTSHFPAALFLPKDAYDVSSQQVLGRRVAGAQLAQAFAGALNTDEMLTIVSPDDKAVESVSGLLAGVTPQGSMVRVCGKATPELLSEVGALYVPDPLISRWTPLRHGVAPWSFSLTGVIHTVCSEGALSGISNIPLAPLYPWDAVVCTSRAGRDVVAKALEHRLETMARRLRVSRPSDDGLQLPELPIIPLVVKATQPYRSELSRSKRRLHARKAMALSPDAFVVAFVGRLSFHSKCHPISLYRALEQLALEHPGREIVLVECGHIFNKWIASAYEQLRARFPHVQFRLVGGLEPATEEQKWQVLAAADVFTSPADNLQETFGLSLLEAMAAELPLVVSDWNGYRDLVVDGDNGFLIPTKDVLFDLSGADEIDAQFSLGTLDYDAMVGVRSMGVVVDHSAYVRALSTLLVDRDLRLAMECASLERLKSCYSAPAVSASYRELWESLEDKRSKASRDSSSEFLELPPNTPSYAELFNHYATSGYGSLEDATIHQTDELTAHLSSSMNQWLLDRLSAGRLADLQGLLDAEGSVDFDVLRSRGFTEHQALKLLAVLSKFSPPS